MRSFKKYLVILVCLFSHLNTAYSQIDSLKNLLNSAKNDTSKLNILIQLSNECDYGEISRFAIPAIDLANQLLEKKDLSTYKPKLLKQKATALNNMGTMFYNTSDIIKAIEYYNLSLKVNQETNDEEAMSEVLNNIGLIYADKGDIPQALNYYHKSLKILERSNNKKGLGFTLNNIGLIYFMQRQYSKALEYFEKSLNMQKEINNKDGMALAFNNIGALYRDKKNIPLSLENYTESLKLREELNDVQGIGVLLNNFAVIYYDQGNFTKCIESNQKSLKISRKLNDKANCTTTFNNLATAYFTQKKYDLARLYADSSLQLSKKIGFPENIRNAESNLARIDSAKGNYDKAYMHFKQYIVYRDSINNEESRKASIRSQLNYEFEKKEAVIKEQQEKDRVIAQEKNRFQQIVIASVLFGLILVIIFAFYAFRSLKATRKQKLTIEEKQREILDSIHYAKRIQTALMTNENYINNSLNKLQKTK